MTPQYKFSGKVISGQKRGRLLGFPTANIRLPMPIPEGIYASKIYLGHKEYHAATFIGNAKTFNESDKKAECYILDFDEDIYGHEITVELFKKIRDNLKFTTAENLIKQMKKDVILTREFFRKI